MAVVDWVASEIYDASCGDARKVVYDQVRLTGYRVLKLSSSFGSAYESARLSRANTFATSWQEGLILELSVKKEHLKSRVEKR